MGEINNVVVHFNPRPPSIATDIIIIISILFISQQLGIMMSHSQLFHIISATISSGHASNQVIMIILLLYSPPTLLRDLEYIIVINLLFLCAINKITVHRYEWQRFDWTRMNYIIGVDRPGRRD